MMRSMRVVLVGVCLALLACGTPPAGDAPSPATVAKSPPVAPEPPGFSRAECLADFDELAQRAAAEWAYAEDKRDHAGVDLQRLASEAKHSLPDPTSLATLNEALHRFLAGMKDGHAIEMWSPWAPGSHVWPFTVTDTSDGLVVAAVAEGTPDLRPGDTLLAVNREPVEARIADEMQRVSASTGGARRAAAIRAMQHTDEPRVRCLLQRPAGPLMEIVLDTLPLGREALAFDKASSGPASRRIGDVGYVRVEGLRPMPDSPVLRITSGTPEEQRQRLEPTLAAFRQAFSELADTRALIVDLRATGGNDVVAMEMARLLLPPDATYAQIQSRLADGKWSPKQRQSLPPGPAVEHYGRSVVVLIDEGTNGGAETLATCLRDTLPGTRFVGRPSAGSPAADGDSWERIELPHSGAVVMLPTQRVYGPAGALIEGRGVVPDVAVRWTRDDVVMARDPDLEAALALLARPER